MMREIEIELIGGIVDHMLIEMIVVKFVSIYMLMLLEQQNQYIQLIVKLLTLLLTEILIFHLVIMLPGDLQQHPLFSYKKYKHINKEKQCLRLNGTLLDQKEIHF